MRKNNKVTKAKAIIAGLAVLGAGTVGTMALLTDTTTATITITSANLGMVVNENAGAGTYTVEMDSSNLKPGDTREGTITVKNTGSIDADISAQLAGVSNFTATLENIDGTPFASDTFEKGETRDLTLKVTLPAGTTTPPADENLSVTFNAEQ